jgi:hypothetical protein
MPGAELRVAPASPIGHVASADLVAEDVDSGFHVG